MFQKDVPPFGANRTRMICGLAVLFQASALNFALGQAVYSNPAGYVKLGNTTVGEDAVPANTDMRISVPLEPKKEFVGTVDSTTATTLVVADSPNFSTDQWNPASGEPYQVKITNGSEEGLWSPILSHTGDTLTLSPVVGDLTAIAVGDSIEILKCWTVGSLFEGQTIPPGTQLLLFSGTTPGEDISSDVILVWSGTSWIYLLGRPDGADPNADDVILHPGESFIVRTLGNPIVKLTAFGDVPLNRHRSIISKLDGATSQDSAVGYYSPVPEMIGDSGLGFSPGDQLLVFDRTSAGQNKSAEKILVYSGSDWIGLLGISGIVSDSFSLQPGEGYVYRQASAVPAGDSEWSDEQNYNE